MDGCIFCKIAIGEIPSTTIFENEDYKVILDASPANLGHCLVILKSHSESIFDIPKELIGKGYEIAQDIAKAVRKATKCHGINILQNNGAVAGQSVFHYHIHIIPRLDSDDVSIDFGSFKVAKEAKEHIATVIKKSLKESLEISSEDDK